MKNVNLYKQLHKINPSYGGGGREFLPALNEIINFLKPKSILDYGCGKGGLVKALAEKYPSIKVYGYDPAVEEFEKMPTDKVDFVICTDVLEHIPEDELPDTLSRIASLSQNVFFICIMEKRRQLCPMAKTRIVQFIRPRSTRNYLKNIFRH